MRASRARRTDTNQTALVKAFRKLGCSVLVLNAEIDFLVGYGGLCIAIEAKDGSKPPSARKLTPNEEDFRLNWKGGYRIVENLDQVQETVDVLRGWQRAIRDGLRPTLARIPQAARRTPPGLLRIDHLEPPIE